MKLRKRGLPNECGHKDLPHFGKGRCAKCYQTWRYNSRRGKKCIKEYRKTEAYKTTERNVHLKKHYGITKNEYDDLEKSQNFKCAICGEKETSEINGKIKKLSVDHSHKTKKVRGLLCHNCNVLIGHAKENKYILTKALEYLTKHSGE